jgi:YD repeat-containing protein
MRSDALGRMFTLAVSVALGLLSGSFPAWALNENESVGFQSNHAFESGQFGENIDVMNGGLNLSIPIGPRYQVNDTLSYGVTLAYGSKIYRANAVDGNNNIIGISNTGLGFTMNLGRLYRDVRKAGDAADCTWYYVTPDGNQHPFRKDDVDKNRSCNALPYQATSDGTFYTVANTPFDGWNGSPSTAPVFTIKSPDGTIYTLGHLVQVDSGSLHLERDTIYNGWDDDAATRYNQDFGGWYVTRITSTRSDGTTDYVNVNYDAHTGFEHVIGTITDSLNRAITFTNTCNPGPTDGCNEPTGATCPDRSSVQTCAVSVPAFNNTGGVFASKTATYNFTYDWRSVTSNWSQQPSVVYGPVSLLTRIDFPTVTNHASSQTPRYTMTFGYEQRIDGTINNGEIVQRIVPTDATFAYIYGNYGYTATSPGGAGPNVVSETHNIVTKTLTLAGESNPATWSYEREGTTAGNPQSNPLYVIATDPVGNDTIYRYLASRSDPDAAMPSTDQENGWTPEWNDGVNYSTEYYQGHGAGRRLVRVVTQEYDADMVGLSRSRLDVRSKRQVTTYIDDDSKATIVANNDWDSKGHWKTVSESGDGIGSTRTTRREYYDYDPARLLMQETSDGTLVVSRAENQYDTNGRPTLNIQRMTLPATVGQPATPLLPIASGDVLTTFTYDGHTGNPLVKEVGNQGVSAGVLNSPAYRIRYTWTGGGYLARKEFYDWSVGAYFPWKAIDRSRDGNTGLITSSSDTAGVVTSYLYDELGRVTDIMLGSPEYPTQIEYVDNRHTTVRQGDTAVMGSNYSCAVATGDFMMVCYEYDTLGRLTKTQKRPADSAAAIPHQTTEYNILGWKTFESEWEPDATVAGTTYVYTDPLDSTQSDPFGRVRKVVTADSKETSTRYFGLSSEVTVKGLGAPDGTLFDAATTYERDVWGRLISVFAPVPGTGQTGSYLYGGSDAHYTYDTRDDLIEVALVDRATQVEQQRRFEYDPLNRLLNSYNPESGPQSIAGYDPLGNVTDAIDASGNHLLSTYDGAGRLTVVRRQDYQKPGGGVPAIVGLLQNTYDQTGVFGQWSLGKLTTTQDFDDTGAWVHTLERYFGGLNGRPSSERHFFDGWSLPTDPVPIGYSYNSFGQIDTLTYPEGAAGKGGAFSIVNKYSNGYPTEVWDPSQPIPPTQGAEAQAVVTYNAAGGIFGVVTHGSMRTSVSADSRWRPQSITIGKSNGTDFTRTDYASGTYTYDGAGNIVTIGTNQYGYDAANRLVRAVDTTDGTVRKQTFQYDDFGNMLEKSQYDLSDTLVRNDVYQAAMNTNRLMSHQVDSSPNSIYLYDQRGNVIQGDSQTFDIDARNRVLGIRTSANGLMNDIAHYGYDSGANRVRKLDVRGDLWAYYVRDSQGRLLSEFRRTRSGDYTPEWVKHYIYIGDRLIGLKENTVPAPPGLITATVNRSAHTVSLSWTPPPTGEGYTIANYKVYRSLNTSPPTWTLKGSPTSLTFVDSVTNNTTYKYIVTAVDTSGKEGYGVGTLVVLAGDILLPNTPTGLAGVAGEGRVDLSWNANGSSELVVGYHVYRGVGTGSSVRITQVPVSATTFADEGLSDGTSYRYSISAVDSSSLESTKTAEITLVPMDYTPPDVPRGLRATADCTGGSAVTVTWEGSPQADSVSYTVFRTPPFGGPPPLPTYPSQTSSSQSFLDTDTSPGNLYTYSVRALDSGGNVSILSRLVSVRTRASGGLTAPGTPYALSGDGKVTLNIVRNAGTRTRIYRKRNVDLGCPAYQFVNETTSGGDFTDAAVQNAVAWDYVLTNLDDAGNESAFSPTAVAIPTATPKAVDTCIEELPAEAEGTGAILCSQGSTQMTPYRRLSVRWSGLPEREYEPYSDHSDGTLGYLKGIRLYRYTPSLAGGGDQSSFLPMLDDYHKSYCQSMPDVACVAGTCPELAGDACKTPKDGGTADNDGFGICVPSGENCMIDSDCAAGSTCQSPPTDAALLRRGEWKWNGMFQNPSVINMCLAARAVYKVYVNGHWRTVESGLGGDVGDPAGTYPADRCVDHLNDVCGANLLPTAHQPEANHDICPATSTLPRATAAPTISKPSPGTLTVTWTPPAGRGNCALASPDYCYSTACVTSPALPADSAQYCAESDAWRCRLSAPRSCDLNTDCPQIVGQVCVPNTANLITGYRVYLTEVDTERHHFVRPASIATVSGSTTTYTITGLSDILYAGNPPTPTQFYARVASIDQFGRTSEPSAASATVTPDASPDSIKPPGSLEVLIWTDNDAGSDNEGIAGVQPHSPTWRLIDGIKLTWKDRYRNGNGSVLGYRVWRKAPDGSWCALLKPASQGDPNPAGVAVCTNEVTGQLGDPNAASAYYTTSSAFGDRIYDDRTVLPGVVHTYSVSVSISSGDSGRSAEVQGIAYPHPPLPLSPPANLQAYAPDASAEQGHGIYLRWCKSEPIEAVDHYKVYRSQGAAFRNGPFTLLATLPASCLDQNNRCAITSVGQNVLPGALYR